jgi:predicted small integral membrane protein
LHPNGLLKEVNTKMRISKIVLVATLALFGALGLLNFMGWEQGTAQVAAITSMAGIPEAQRAPWATDNAVIVALGYLFIALGKLSGGACCAVGAVRMWQARSASAQEFQAAKAWASIGVAVFLFLFFGGFMYLANQFFMGWRTELGDASAEGAFALGASVALIGLFVNQAEP